MMKAKDLNDIEMFLEEVAAVYCRLNPPWPFGPEDDDDRDHDAHIMDHQLAICFPNLTADERDLIADAHFDSLAVTLLSNTPEGDLGLADRPNLDAGLERVRVVLRESSGAIERYGLRVKLGDFQERLLDYFITPATPAHPSAT